jgi:hypothetical protein
MNHGWRSHRSRSCSFLSIQVRCHVIIFTASGNRRGEGCSTPGHRQQPTRRGEETEANCALQRARTPGRVVNTSSSEGFVPRGWKGNGRPVHPITRAGRIIPVFDWVIRDSRGRRSYFKVAYRTRFASLVDRQ